ncbi:DUF4381 family protein [Coraliomargarita sp. SDUM461004]|uniref:DUF4381 family protein n=1 Tax=Thalassobacterium sedimentorum TaxID=3041258 RepID=A0ABU1AEM1_9BACT|nr:DUF4381 family protein [Coraliomargarita sp. SDUM461004]MDQ8193212.1 DUF4381 family protein [Coraliomargarita sp. SDUM461004]
MPTSAPQLPPLPEGPGLDRVRGPIEIPTHAPWPIALAIGVAILLIALLLWRLLRARRSRNVAPAPYEAAIAELEVATQLTNDDHERFAILSSQALRRYLENGLGLRFNARTSEEFLHDLKDNPTFDPNFHQTLSEVLTTLDQIKFAQHALDTEARRQLSNQIHQLIDQAHSLARQQEGAPA